MSPESYANESTSGNNSEFKYASYANESTSGNNSEFNAFEQRFGRRADAEKRQRKRRSRHRLERPP